MWHTHPDTQCVAPGDRSFWQGLWQSDAFRALLADERTGYAALLDRAVQQPWWFYPITQPHEHRHFSVWFGQAIARRHYDNPVLHDLYIIHDVLHGLTFQDDPSSSEAAWRQRMRANEILVSLETEALIYLRAPALRAASFDQVIAFDSWADPAERQALEARQAAMWPSLSRHPHEQALNAARPTDWPLALPPSSPWSTDDLWAQRRVMTHAPDLNHVWEQWIAHYESDAEAFYDDWAPHWRHIETERQAFSQLCADGRWLEAKRRREALWTQHADDYGVPYGHIVQGVAHSQK